MCGSSREVHASFARRKLARYSITEPRASRLSCDQSSCPGIALSFQKMIPTSPSRPLLEFSFREQVLMGAKPWRLGMMAGVICRFEGHEYGEVPGGGTSCFFCRRCQRGKISVKRSRNNDYIYPFFEKLDLFSRRARKNTQMTEEHIYTYRVLVPGTITINPDIGDTYLPSHSQSNKPSRSR